MSAGEWMPAVVLDEMQARIDALEAEVERLSVARIALTKGQFTTIDADDVPLVTGYKWHAVKAGDGLWYAVGRRKLYLHHLLLPRIDGMVVDHINGDSLDNRRCNLQLITHAENITKGRKPSRADKTSVFRGVSQQWSLDNDKPWGASITVARQKRFLGYFGTQEDAARAYDAAALEYHGRFAQLNFPEEHEEAIAS